MPYLDRRDDVAILNLGEPGVTDSENRFHPDWIAAVDSLIDEVLATEGPLALVTCATGKFYSNGLDLEWLLANPDSAGSYVDDVHLLFARLLTLPMITVAAMPGHTFAAGAMLALAHDRRVMRADRGFFCLPEVDINIPFTPGMSSLIMGKLPRAAAHDAMTTGRRYGGGDALAAGIVDEVASEEAVLERAVEWAAGLTGKRGHTLGVIKARMYAETVDLLTTPGSGL